MRYPLIEGERYGSDTIVNALAEADVRYVLGMPGGLTGPLWKSLNGHPTIRALQVREESIGSLMAEAYGRLTGQPAVVMGQGEWIVGNAGQGYLEALLGQLAARHPHRDVRRRASVAPRAVSDRHRRLRYVGRPHGAGGSHRSG